MAHKAEQLKKLHKQKIKDYFYDQIQCNKIELSEETGISKTTCTTILKELLEEQVIYQVENSESTGGRPSKQYKLNQDYWHGCLVDIRNFSQVEIEIQVWDLYGEVVLKKIESMTTFSMAKLYEMLDEVCKKDSKIEVITISIPGVVRKGACIDSSDIEELEGRNLELLLTSRYEKEVVVENDVNLAVVGYHTKEDSIAFLYQPKEKFTGCGIMLNHQLYRGSTLFAGELGNLVQNYKTEPSSEEIAKNIIVKQMNALICILNPKTISISTAFSYTKQDLYHELLKNIPMQHIPELFMVPKLEKYVFRGLMEAAVDEKRNHIAVKDIRKI